MSADQRPFVLLSCAMSVDGYIDDDRPRRLLLSNEEDFDRVDALRADSDAILVGATTLRRDNPRLVVRSATRRAMRTARGLSPHPVKVTVTASGDLDRDLSFWHHGGSRLVYCPDRVVGILTDRLNGLAEVVGLGTAVDVHALLRDLGARGVRRLMIEGGERIHTQFLAAGMVDEIQLAVAPFFVGDPTSPRLVGPGSFIYDSGNRMNLSDVRAIGDIALLRYVPRRAG